MRFHGRLPTLAAAIVLLITGIPLWFPDSFAAGLQRHSVREKYYFGRFSQRVNRVVDISDFVEKKIDANLVNLAQGPAGRHGSQLRARLAKEGRRLPLLGADDLPRGVDAAVARQGVAHGRHRTVAVGRAGAHAVGNDETRGREGRGEEEDDA